MKRIAVFGCSWTQGVDPEYYSWSKCLAKSRPDIHIDDYSKGGTSLKWSVSQLLATANINYDYKIFQVTAPYRITLSPSNLNYQKLYKFGLPNHRSYSSDLAQKIITINSNYYPRMIEGFSDKSIKNFQNVYYSTLNYDIENFEYQLYIDYVMKNTDFVFFHREMDKQTARLKTSIQSIETVLGLKEFKKYVYDNGYHLDSQGCQKVCEWIISQTNL